MNREGEFRRPPISAEEEFLIGITTSLKNIISMCENSSIAQEPTYQDRLEGYKRDLAEYETRLKNFGRDKHEE